MAKYLKQQKIRFQTPTLDRMSAWATTAADPAVLSERLTEHIDATEQELAKLLVKTPYVLLLSVTGINVVSAATLAGEAGPIEHYASASALKEQAGLYPSRYQSDRVDIQTSVA